MSTFRKLLLKFLKPLAHHLERAVHRLRTDDWEPALDERTREVLNGGCYSVDGKEAAMAAVLYAERIEPPQNGATVRVVEDRNEYRIKAALIRPHGLDYEARGPLAVVSVKKPEPLKNPGAPVILSAKAFADSVAAWKDALEPIQLQARTKAKRAR